MSIAGILSSNLFSAGAALNPLRTHGINANAPKFEEIKDQFQQLGQDLKSGNLKQAQADYATLSSDFPGTSQTGATAAVTTAATSVATSASTPATTTAAATSTTGSTTAAQQDFTNIQQGVQQIGTSQVGAHHHRHGHHHHGGGTQSATSVTPSSQQSNAVAQAFSTLGQDLKAGNLSGAQSAFATLQNDLQQIGGFSSSGSNSSSPTSTASSSTTGGSLNVRA